MRRLLLALGLALCPIHLAAQAPPPAPPVAPLTPSHQVAIENLLEAMGMDSMLTKANPMLEMLRNQPDTPPGMLEAMEVFLAKYLRWEDLKPDFVQVYAESLSEDDAVATTAFYRSPAGARFMAAQTGIMVRTEQIIQARLMEHLDELMELLEPPPPLPPRTIP